MHSHSDIVCVTCFMQQKQQQKKQPNNNELVCTPNTRLKFLYLINEATRFA